MKNLYIITLLIFSFSFAQESLGGLPYSFSANLDDNIAMIETELVDHEAMLLEDEGRPMNTPFRYGKKFEDNYNFFYTCYTRDIR